MYRRLLIIVTFIISFVGFSQLTDKDKEFLRQELFDKINELRVSKGLSPLISNDTLKKGAELHSEYMAKNDILSHDQRKSKYATPKKRVIAVGGKNFEIIGENVLYSIPQDFPLKKKELIELADAMFLNWKNSPGHYANMIESEYVFGDLGFKTNSNKNIVYATHVFGTKGQVVENQISNNSFGLTRATTDCEKEFKEYSNLILNMGNNVEIKGDEVIYYHHNKSYFKKIFSGPNDGIAIDLISRDQLLCGKPNHLDFSPVYDGILLKPVYSSEMLTNNRAESAFRVITKVGDIPDNLQADDYSPSVVLIKNGKACKNIYPTYVPKNDYELRPIEPIIKDVNSVQLIRKGISQTQIIHYDFKTSNPRAIKLPHIFHLDNKVHSVQINSFSSVEGDSLRNEKLHNTRANFISNHLKSKLGLPSEEFIVSSKENWDQMFFQLNYFERDDLAGISRDSLREILKNRDNSLPWDSLLFSQREATAIINYTGEYKESDSLESLAEFNLRTAVAIKDIPLVNKALYEMYIAADYNPSILFEPQIIKFIKTHPKTLSNYTALLSFNYYHDPYLITDFIYSWLNRVDEMDNDARTNILHLYTLVGTHLLDNWDVPSERLSNVIHPIKIEKIISGNVKSELMLNLHLTFIEYFGQVNDSPNIAKSFYFIADYFKKNSLKKEDDVDLALFFNNWSMYRMTVKHLLSRFEENNLNEDGLFILAQTMNFTDNSDNSKIYLEVQEKALQENQKRWCHWLSVDFQIKRNYLIKRMYCEVCE